MRLFVFCHANCSKYIIAQIFSNKWSNLKRSTPLWIGSWLSEQSVQMTFQKLYGASNGLRWMCGGPEYRSLNAGVKSSQQTLGCAACEQHLWWTTDEEPWLKQVLHPGVLHCVIVPKSWLVFPERSEDKPAEQRTKWWQWREFKVMAFIKWTLNLDVLKTQMGRNNHPQSEHSHPKCQNKTCFLHLTLNIKSLFCL